MSSPSRRQALILAVVFALALGLRLAYLRELYRSPYARALVGDEEMYDERARAVTRGDLGLGSRPYYQDPLYPYVLGGVYRVLGPDPFAARCLQAALGAATAAAVAAFVLAWRGAIAGAVAGLLMAASRSLVFYDAQLEKTALTVALTAAGLAALAGLAARTSSRPLALAAGILCGAFGLVRGNGLLLLPLALLFVAAATRAPGTVLLFGLGAALAVLPATFRNRLVSGEWVLVTSQGGQNFYLGNWPGNESGLYLPPPFLRPHPRHEELDFAREAERRAGRPLNAAEVSRFWWREGLAAVAASPARFLRLSLKRLGLALHPADVGDNYDMAFLSRTLPLLGRPLPDAWILVGLGLPGLVLAAAGRSGGAAGRLLAGFVLFYLLTLIPFFVFGRYRIPLFPALAAGAGALVAEAVAAGRARRTGWLVAASGGVAVTLVALARMPPLPDQTARGFNTLGAILERQGERAEAARAYSGAVATDPEDPLALANRARLLCGEGQVSEALALYARSIARRPEIAEVHANHGACLLDARRFAEAEAALGQALRLDPGLLEARYNLATLAETAGRTGEARALFAAVAGQAGPGSRLGAAAAARAAALGPSP